MAGLLGAPQTVARLPNFNVGRYRCSALAWSRTTCAAKSRSRLCQRTLELVDLRLDDAAVVRIIGP
jgi:hypothetical protein